MKGTSAGEVVAFVLGWLLAFALGLLAGAVLTFVHREWAPWGLLAALAVDAALLVGLRLVFGRLKTAAAAAGVLAATAMLALPGPGGSIVMAETEGAFPLGDVWALAPTVLAIVVLVWPEPRAGRPRRAPSAPPDAPGPTL